MSKPLPVAPVAPAAPVPAVPTVPTVPTVPMAPGAIDVAALQATLRDFAAARDWPPFHTPKNLAMALMVEAAELAEIFQWQTPAQSVAAGGDAASHERIADEAADVLLYLLQLVDHCGVDLAAAAQRKLAKNAIKHPVGRPPLA